jgi:hypothetical protein
MYVCCAVTHENVISLFFLDEGIIAINLFNMFGKLGSSLQLKNSSNILSIQLDSALVRFAHTVHDCLNVNFPVDGQEEEKQLSASPLLILRRWTFSL